MKCIRRMTVQDREAINQLRVGEFQRSGQFELLKPERLLWNHVDDENIVLAALRAPGQPVSTMRGVVVGSAVEASAFVECTVPRHVAFPAIVFSSAATHQDYRKLGLNQAIRYHFLTSAVRCGIESILSPIYIGAPRITFMKALGYTFEAPEKCWQTKLNPKTQRILGVLTRNHFRRALAHIQQTRPQILERYPWRGKLIDLIRQPNSQNARKMSTAG